MTLWFPFFSGEGPEKAAGLDQTTARACTTRLIFSEQ